MRAFSLGLGVIAAFPRPRVHFAPMDRNDGAQAPSDERLMLDWRSGDAAAFDAVFGEHRKRLHRMAEIRISPVLRSRVDASDVIQMSMRDCDRL